MKKSPPVKKMSQDESMKRAIADSKAIQGEFYKPSEWSAGILAEIHKNKLTKD